MFCLGTCWNTLKGRFTECMYDMQFYSHAAGGGGGAGVKGCLCRGEWAWPSYRLRGKVVKHAYWITTKKWAWPRHSSSLRGSRWGAQFCENGRDMHNNFLYESLINTKDERFFLLTITIIITIISLIISAQVYRKQFSECCLQTCRKSQHETQTNTWCSTLLQRFLLKVKQKTHLLLLETTSTQQEKKINPNRCLMSAEYPETQRKRHLPAPVKTNLLFYNTIPLLFIRMGKTTATTRR